MGKKGKESTTNWNRRQHLVMKGRASFYLPRYTLEEAIKKAGLP